MKNISSTLAAVLIVGSASMNAESLSNSMKVWAVAPEASTSISATVPEDGTPKKKAKKAQVAKPAMESDIEKQLRELRETQAKQQAEIEALKKANADKDAQLAAANAAAAAASSQAAAAAASSQDAAATAADVKTLKSNVADLQTTSVGIAATVSANKVELSDKMESPSAIHYKGVTITPVLVVMADGVVRQRSVNSDEPTPLASIPFPGSNEYSVSEQNFDARQSRFGALFAGKAGDTKMSAYFEADFLGAGTTSNNNQSNSYVLRQRQFWGRFEKKGFALTGGQAWSLATENRKGTDVRTEIQPNTVDPNYVVGYTWERQPGFRVQNKFEGTPITLAASVEESQITGYSSVATPGNFFFAGTGLTSGAFNSFGNGSAQTYTNNVAPDVLFKATADFPHDHFEVGGLAVFFREVLYPGIANPLAPAAVVTGALPYNNLTLGGGIFASARHTNKYFEVAGQGMVGDGTGRYGSAQLATVTVHPDGTLEPVRNVHGMLSVEAHPSSKFDLFGYYGGEYAQRTVYATGVAATPFTGYGAINLNDTGCMTPPTTLSTTGGSGGSASTQGTCSGVIRYIQEQVYGFQYKPVVSKTAGQILFRATYSYVQRNLWTGLLTGTYGSSSATFGQPKTNENMVHVSLRYVLP